MRRAHSLLLSILAVSSVWFPCTPVHGQQLVEQAAAFSVWLDFQALLSPDPPKVSLPIWLEGAETQSILATDTAPAQTLFRLRLRKMPGLNNEILFRLFFEDRMGASPVVTAWTETGASRFRSAELGIGSAMVTSVVMTIPVADTDYIDITVPGDGNGIVGVFLSSLKKTVGLATLDFAPDLDPNDPAVADPFGNMNPVATPVDDLALFGRIRATLDEGPLIVAPKAAFDIQIDAIPAISFLQFETMNLDPTYPPQLIVNGHFLGPVMCRLPDLADPGYRGSYQAMEVGKRYHYAGWLSTQAIIPASALHVGVNRIELVISKASSSVLIRSVELQLKHDK